MSSFLVPLPPPPAKVEVRERKGWREQNWHFPKLVPNFLCLVDVCSIFILSRCFHGFFGGSYTWLWPSLGACILFLPTVAAPLYPAFLVVHCIYGFHRSWNGIKLVLSTSAQSPLLDQHWNHKPISVHVLHFSCSLLLTRFLRKK